VNRLLKECRYARAHETLWRDTGLHVVALGPHDDGEVTVLGGGSALLWRLLDEPLGLDEISQRLRSTGAAPDEVEACLDDLLERGLVAWMIVEDEL
jgi:hypothetical protein